MRRALNSLIFCAFLTGLVIAGALPAALAAPMDGIWSVLIVTEKGECDHAYRYAVKIANGHVSYAGDASIDMSGSVAPNGAVKVNIRLGDKGANGSGRLSGQTGSGVWRGVASNAACAGRWEAERR
jgi:2-methylaconitate cis-trans-isomerase PrpF